MKFYFTITFNNGSKLGGHNCTKFEMKDDFLILEGYDEFNFVSGYERKYWRFNYELAEIKEFNIEKMVDKWCEDNKWI